MTPKQLKIKKILNILQGENKAETLKEILVLINDGLSREEFLESFKKVVEHTLSLEVKALEKINKAISELKGENNISLEATQADLRGFKSELEQSINSLMREQENSLNFIKDKVRGLKDGRDGLDGVKGNDGKDGKDGKDADDKKIKELEREIEELKKRPIGKGGGTSAMGVAQAFKWILKTETPVGDINGVNTEYTVKQTIFAVLAFSLNGEVVCQLPNYTISANKIIFSTALPADYAGRDFEIKYV